MFNSAKRQGRSAVTDDIDIVVLYNKTFEHVETGEIRDDSGRYMHLLGVRELQNICDTVVNLLIRTVQNKSTFIILQYLHSKLVFPSGNDVDGGIFVCFFL